MLEAGWRRYSAGIILAILALTVCMVAIGDLAKRNRSVGEIKLNSAISNQKKWMYDFLTADPSQHPAPSAFRQKDGEQERSILVAKLTAINQLRHKQNLEFENGNMQSTLLEQPAKKIWSQNNAAAYHARTALYNSVDSSWQVLKKSMPLSAPGCPLPMAVPAVRGPLCTSAQVLDGICALAWSDIPEITGSVVGFELSRSPRQILRMFDLFDMDVSGSLNGSAAEGESNETGTLKLGTIRAAGDIFGRTSATWNDGKHRIAGLRPLRLPQSPLNTWFSPRRTNHLEILDCDERELGLINIIFDASTDDSGKDSPVIATILSRVHNNPQEFSVVRARYSLLDEPPPTRGWFHSLHVYSSEKHLVGILFSGDRVGSWMVQVEEGSAFDFRIAAMLATAIDLVDYKVIRQDDSLSGDDWTWWTHYRSWCLVAILYTICFTVLFCVCCTKERYKTGKVFAHPTCQEASAPTDDAVEESKAAKSDVVVDEAETPDHNLSQDRLRSTRTTSTIKTQFSIRKGGATRGQHALTLPTGLPRPPIQSSHTSESASEWLQAVSRQGSAGTSPDPGRVDPLETLNRHQPRPISRTLEDIEERLASLRRTADKQDARPAPRATEV